jgi:thymidylate synthase
MTSFNPVDAPQGVLYPCHGICIQFHVAIASDKKVLSLSMTQRSADIFCGVPFNIASYALLVHIMCGHLGNEWIPGDLCIVLNDVHLYEGHKAAALRQLLRDPVPFPTLRITRPILCMDDLTMEYLELCDYFPAAAINVTMVA